jgi:hypothetical protein
MRTKRFSGSSQITLESRRPETGFVSGTSDVCLEGRRSTRQAIAPKRAVDSLLTSVRAFRREDEILGLLGAVGILSKQGAPAFRARGATSLQFCSPFVFNGLRHNKFWYSGSLDGYLAQFRYSRCYGN